MQQKSINSNSLYRPLSPPRRQNPNEVYKTRHISASQSFSKFQIINHRQVTKPKDEMQFIYSGDFIRLKHGETSGYLCFDDTSYKTPSNNAYVRMYKGDDQLDTFTTNCLFEIEAHDDIKQETIIHAGRKLDWKVSGTQNIRQVRFRHVNSG